MDRKSGRTNEYCELCHCLKSQAWPRLPDPGCKKELKSLILTDLEMNDAVAAGCLACELLRQGLGHHWPIRDLAEETRPRKCWVGPRETDSGWLVSLYDSQPKAVLEFVDATGNSDLLRIEDKILIISMKMRTHLTRFQQWTLLKPWHGFIRNFEIACLRTEAVVHQNHSKARKQVNLLSLNCEAEHDILCQQDS